MIEFSIEYTKEKRNMLNEIQKEILSGLASIKKTYSSLDETVWNNKEKKVLDNVFGEYLKKQEEITKNTFDHDIKLIDYSIKAYEEGNQVIKNSIGDANGKVL